MKNFWNKIKAFVLAHKIWSAIILIVVIFIGHAVYGKLTSTTGDTRYVTAAVQKGNIVASVSGTGQVSASNQIDAKPKASGDVVYVGAKNGDKVSAGAVLVELDSTDARKSVRDAEASLESAQISLQKFKIDNSEANMSAEEEKAYADGFNAVADTFLDLPSIDSGLSDIFSTQNLSDNAASAVSNNAVTLRNKAEQSYFLADNAFKQNQKDYIVLNTNSAKSDIEKIISETSDTTKNMADAVKNTLDYINYMSDQSNKPENFSSSKTSLAGYTSTVATHLTALSSAKTNIDNNKDTGVNTSLDLQSAELDVTQKENALQDAKDKLADYVVRAPFAGTVANMTIKKGDSASTGTAVATVLTAQQIAEVSMNEVDVAKIKIGEKATLTFDAIPDLSIAGVVEEIDSIGTVAQGVVTYNVKITFDTQDDRVKPSMSVSADIITDMKTDILVVPNSAVKSQNGASYVEMFGAPIVPPTDGLVGTISKIPPNKIPVEVGLSNDSQTEIVSGIKEGDEVVIRTILPNATTAAATAPSLFGGGARPAGGAATGGNSRFTTGGGR